jgi:methionyl-tRNA formyltransferase
VRVLFWGTSSFATPSLAALLGEGFEVATVITQPDRPTGRSRSVAVPPPVKEIALRERLEVLQPELPRGEPFMDQLRAIDPDISVVVSYGHILRQEVIDLPRLGTLNVHASLLPKLRGASPIQAAIREGLIETGVTIMRMVQLLDAGPIVLQARAPILSDETYGELELRLSELGALALVEALTLIDVGAASERPQDESQVTYAGKIDREMARVRWDEGCGVVARQIRAYDPRPGAFTTHRGSEVKLFGGAASEEASDEGPVTPGDIVQIDSKGMLVACGDGAVRIPVVQPSGKRQLSPADWARGRGVSVGERLGA